MVATHINVANVSSAADVGRANEEDVLPVRELG